MMESAGNLSMVELKLNGVSLADLVNLLHKVYDSKNLIMLHELKFIRTAQGEKGLDCSMTFTTPKG
jgi:metal-sulfur cluster biosynthetic enzyme